MCNNIVMASKYDSYCKYCGRPIFVGDFIEYDKITKKVKCVCCYFSVEKDDKCPHWAISSSSYSITSSNRYKSYYNDGYSYTKCIICGQELKLNNLNNNTRYYQEYNTSRHGKSSYTSSSFDSYILIGKFDQENNPDDMAKLVLVTLLNRNNFDSDIIDIIKNHIQRIYSTYRNLKIYIPDLKKYVQTNTDKFIYSKMKEDFNNIHRLSIEYIKSIIRKEDYDNLINYLKNCDYEVFGYNILISYLILVVNYIDNKDIKVLLEFMKNILINSIILTLSKESLEVYILQIKKMLDISENFYDVLIKFIMYDINTKLI